MLDGIKILDGKDKTRTPEALPSLLGEALGVSFDKHVGYDYIEDVQGLDLIGDHTKEKRYSI